MQHVEKNMFFVLNLCIYTLLKSKRHKFNQAGKNMSGRKLAWLLRALNPQYKSVIFISTSCTRQFVCHSNPTI